MRASRQDIGERAGLVLTTLGVVFGDIGTSHLYALRVCFSGKFGVPVMPDNVLGVVAPHLEVAVKPVAILVLIGLFSIQHRGTARISGARAFSH